MPKKQSLSDTMILVDDNKSKDDTIILPDCEQYM